MDLPERADQNPSVPKVSTPRLVGTLLGVAATALSLLLAAGGAATDGDAIRLGFPGALATSAILAAAVLLALRRHASVAVAAGLGVPLLLLVAGVQLAGVRALSGPPLAALALAILAEILAIQHKRSGRPLSQLKREKS